MANVSIANKTKNHYMKEILYLMKKKLFSAYTLASVLLLSACSSEPSAQTTETTETSDKKPSIVAASFHEYDWVNQILGDQKENFDITLLMDNGVDLHSYEPSVEDTSIISSADLFIYNGGPSQDWVADIVAEPLNENIKVINVMESLGDVVVPEVAVEGMQAGDHDHDEEVHSEEEHSHDDEHVWLSLGNAVDICEILEDEISELDSANAAVYKENAAAYVQSLQTLDGAYETAISDASRDTLVFADRFPFLYMMQDYNVNYYAAFQGCSAETEASFETVAFLTQKVDELDVNKLLIIDNGLIELANTIINNSADKDAETLTLNSIQSISQEDIDSGITYYDIMEDNLEVLKEALAQ